jgi:Putative transposase/Transposase zinc-binding domain
MIAPTTERPVLEVADVIRQYGDAFLDRYGGALSRTQRKALQALVACRTAALGGHVEHCLDCGQQRIAYNSCRNRHCPKCQALTRARWLEQQAQHLLPVEYHHVVFTLPAELSDLARANPAVLYDLLLRSAAATLRAVAANPKRLGAAVGVLMVLHTWGQNLHHHPHAHCVVTGGGLSCDSTGTIDPAPRWRACRPGFFLPVRVLSRVFRGKFLAGVRGLLADGTLLLPGRLAGLADPCVRAVWCSSLYAKEWVVYAKRPFGGPAQVLKYLARYTHRVAISNSRLVDLRDGRVTFRYKDYADGHRHKTMTLAADEFLRRFVQHVLPSGFVKVRHYGLLANRRRQERLALCRRLLLVTNVAAALPSPDEVPILPAQPRCCPQCGGTRLIYRELEPAEPKSSSLTRPSRPGQDSS